MIEVTKNDFMFFQNEILGDLKKLDNKLSAQINTVSKNLNEQKTKNEQLFNSYKSKFKDFSTELTKKVDKNSSSDIQSNLEQIHQNLLLCNSSVGAIERDFDNACYKYDRIILNNLQIPGLIGESCTYKNMKEYLIHINKRLNELNVNKDRQEITLKENTKKLEIASQKVAIENEKLKKEVNNICEKFKAEGEINCENRKNHMEYAVFRNCH